MSTTENSDSSINYYDQVKDLSIKQGWVTVNLVQRTFRLSYGYALSLVEALQHRGIIGPVGTAGRHPLITTATENDLIPRGPDNHANK